jgi:hypothetical protein
VVDQYYNKRKMFCGSTIIIESKLCIVGGGVIRTMSEYSQLRCIY